MDSSLEIWSHCDGIQLVFIYSIGPTLIFTQEGHQSEARNWVGATDLAL